VCVTSAPRKSFTREVERSGQEEDGDSKKKQKKKKRRKTTVKTVTTVVDDVMYACATSEGGVALVRARTTMKHHHHDGDDDAVGKSESDAATTKELARDDGDGEAMTSIAMDSKASKVFCASRNGRVVRYDVVVETTPSASTSDGGVSLKRGKTWNPHKSSPVLDMSVDSTGTLLCTGSADRTARVWDIERGYCTHAFRGKHGGAVTATAFHPSPSVARAYPAADAGSVAVWSLNAGNAGAGTKKTKKNDGGCVKFIEDAHVSAVTAIRIDVDSNTLLTAGRDRVVKTFDLDTLKPRSTTAVHESIEDCVILSAQSEIVRLGKVKPPVGGKGVIFAVVGDGGRVRVWREGSAKHSVESTPLVAEKSLTKGGEDEEDDFEAAAGAFTSCALTHGGDRLMGVSGDARLLTYKVDAETATLEIEREIVANTDEVIGLSFVPSSKTAGGGLVDVDKDDDDDDDDDEEEASLASMSLAPKEMAVVTNSPTVRIFDPITMSCVGSLAGHSAVVLCVDSVMATDGTPLIVTGAKDHTVRLWDATTRACVAVGEGHVGAVAAVAFPPQSAKGAPFVISGGADRVLRVWDVDAARREGDGELSATAATVAHDKSLNGVAVAPHLRLVATCSADKTAKVWKMPDLVPVVTLRGHRRGVWACAFSPTDRVLATAGGDKTVRIWSVDDRMNSDTNGACLRTLEGHTAAVLSIRFLSRGTQLATTAGDGLLNVWNVNSGSCATSVDAHDDKAWALAVGGDGDWIATGGTDASMSLWRDSTTTTTAEAAQEHAMMVEQEQAFFNAERAGEVTKAIDLALSLQRPGALLRVLTRLMNEDHANGDARLRECVGPLTKEKLTKVLQCVREWNTNSRTCHIAQHVLAAVFRTHSMEELSKVPGITQIIEACRAYTMRHQSRLQRIYQGTFMVDTLLSRNGNIADDEESVEQLRKSYERIADHGFWRLDGQAAEDAALATEDATMAEEAPSSEDEPADVDDDAMEVEEDEEDEDEDEESEEDEDEDEDESEEEETDEEPAVDEVKAADLVPTPAKLSRMNAIKRLATSMQDERKLMRDPSPRHTRSGKKIGFK
jgi:U3 small nucleolar RNA-associated protein 13